MEDTIFEALGLLMQGAFVCFVYKLAKQLASATDCSRMKAYAAALGVSAFFAGLLWANYGTHTENGDPLYGGGDTVVDFIPAEKERNQHGIFAFTVLGVASLVGTHAGIKQRNK